MKLTVLQENLSKALSQASRFASTRSQLPILGNILLKATKTKLVVSSTNLEISISIKVGAKIEEEGEISIPSKIISELVNNLPKDLITLETDKETLKIATKGFSSKLLGMNSSDFPKIPENVGKEKSVKLSKKQLHEIVPRVIFATSIDETRPILTGVLFVLDKNSLTLVATDGFRLSRKKIDLVSQKEGSVVIPKGILIELLKTSEENDELFIDIQEKEKQVVFGTDENTLTSRLLEGTYPDFEKIIPVSSTIKVRTDKEELLRAVKLASVFAKDSSNIIKMELKEDSMEIAAESGSSGSQKTSIDAKVEISDGSLKGWQISFNFRFLEDFIHSVLSEEVLMEFTNAQSAGVFKDSKDSSYLHLIMPVKIQG